MTNAKSPADSSCFGYIILSSIEDARKCISSLNNTELNGNLISVTFDKVDLMKVSHSSSPFSNTYENYFISLFPFFNNDYCFVSQSQNNQSQSQNNQGPSRNNQGQSRNNQGQSRNNQGQSRNNLGQSQNN